MYSVNRKNWCVTFGKRQLPRTMDNSTNNKVNRTLTTQYRQRRSHRHAMRSSPASVATCYLKSSVAFVHALYYFARLRPLQPLTGRRRRRYSNSTFKSDFPLHNNSVQRLPLYSSFVKNPLICFLCCLHNPQNLSQPFHLKCISSFLLSVQLYLFLSNINWIYILNNYRLLQCYIHTYVLMLSYIT